MDLKKVRVGAAGPLAAVTVVCEYIAAGFGRDGGTTLMPRPHGHRIALDTLALCVADLLLPGTGLDRGLFAVGAFVDVNLEYWRSFNPRVPGREGNVIDLFALCFGV